MSAIRARPQLELKVSVVDHEGWLPELSQRMAEIELGSPLAHPFQTEPFVALLNTDPSRPHYAVIAEDGDGLAAYWWGHFARYKGGLLPRSKAWMRSGPVIRRDLVQQRHLILSLMLAELERHLQRHGVGWAVLVLAGTLAGPLVVSVLVLRGPASATKYAPRRELHVTGQRS